MSFILDALKKSESDRQRQSGPAFFEVKMTPPRTGLPAWAIAIAALLLVNVAIVAWLLLRHPAARSAAAAAPATAEQPATPTPTQPPPAAAAQPPPFSATITASATAPPPPPPPSLQPTAGVTSPALTSPATAVSGASGNADDYLPAAAPAAAGLLGSRVRRGTADGVPLYQDAAGAPGSNVPQLRLDLHVFAPRPEDRFVMINMHKVHEGDTLPEGVHVESITPEGALLSYHGSRFLLPRD